MFLCLAAVEKCKIESQQANGRAIKKIYEAISEQLRKEVQNERTIKKYFKPYCKLKDAMMYNRKQYQGSRDNIFDHYSGQNTVICSDLLIPSPESLANTPLVTLDESILPENAAIQLPAKKRGRPSINSPQESPAKRVKNDDILYDLDFLRKARIYKIDESLVNFAITKLALAHPDIGFAYPVECRKRATLNLKPVNVILQKSLSEWFVLTNISSRWELHGLHLTKTKAKRFIPLLRKILKSLSVGLDDFSLVMVSYVPHNPQGLDSGLWAIAHAVNMCFSLNTTETILDRSNSLIDQMKLCLEKDSIQPFTSNSPVVKGQTESIVIFNS